MLRAVCFALAMVALNLAAAGVDTSDTADGAGIETSTASSQPIPIADGWFDPDALDLNVYGLAYHPDRETAHRLDLDNEFNPGIGLHYELDRDTLGTSFVQIGIYKDSGSNWAKFAALGYQFKLGNYWRLGGALAAVHSETYNQGVTFLAMIPLLTLDLGRIKLNAVYFPKFGHYNQVEAFGFYIGIPFGKPER